MSLVIGGMERQMELLPKEVRWCKKCPISNQRPRLQFNTDGVCSACTFMESEYARTDWAERELELQELLDQYRHKDGSWDCIVASSGGKDSSFTASTLKHKYGMNPLCVTGAPFHRGVTGQRNFNSFIASGYPTIEGHPNGRLHRKLARLYLEEHGDAWGAFGLIQVAWPHWIALQLGIPMVWYSENMEAMYSGDVQLREMPGMPTHLWAEKWHKGTTVDQMLEFGLEHKDYLSEGDFTEADLNYYRAPSADRMEEAGLTMYWLSNFLLYIPEEAYYAAVQHTGFEANPERSVGTWTKYASLDDPVHDAYHFYLAHAKMGQARTVSDAAHEVRDGHLLRDEAVALIHRYDGENPPLAFEEEFCKYLGITAEMLEEIIDAWRPPHLWVKEGDKWLLRHQIGREGPVDGPWNP